MSNIFDKSIRTHLFAINLATSDPSRITNIVPLQTSIEFGRSQSVQCEQELFAAAEAVLLDKEENKDATEIADAAIAEAVEESVVLHHYAQVEIVPIRQKDVVAMGPLEVRRRRNFVTSTFSVYPSRIQYLGRTKAVSYLTDILKACAESGYFSQETLASLAAKVATAEAAINVVKDEELDDAPLYSTLYQARENAASTYQAFRSVVQGALQFSKSPHTIDQFILNEVKKKAPEKSLEVELVLAEDMGANAAANAALVPAVDATVAP